MKLRTKRIFQIIFFSFLLGILFYLENQQEFLRVISLNLQSALETVKEENNEFKFYFNDEPAYREPAYRELGYQDAGYQDAGYQKDNYANPRPETYHSNDYNQEESFTKISGDHYPPSFGPPSGNDQDHAKDRYPHNVNNKAHLPTMEDSDAVSSFHNVQNIDDFTEWTSNKSFASFLGNGIVMIGHDNWVSTNLDYLGYLYHSLRSNLYTEVWYNQNELSQMNIKALESLHPLIKCRTFSEELKKKFLVFQLDAEYMERLEKPFYLKQMAILFSSFKNVLFLDSDNLPVRDPEFIFHSKEFKDTGLVIWKDFFLVGLKFLDVARVTGITYRAEYEKESSQLLVDKQRHWKTLQLSFYLTIEPNMQHDRRLLYGDKETYYLAAKMLGNLFTIVPFNVLPVGDLKKKPTKVCGYGMLHRWFDGIPLFVHANFKKKITCATLEYYSEPLIHQLGITWNPDYCIQFKSGAYHFKLSDTWPKLFGPETGYANTTNHCF